MSWRVWLGLIAIVLLTSGCIKDREKKEGGESYLGEGAISDELPVSRVALYQNGVGYFERVGTVEGDEIVLRIRPDQINDILKSLTVIDLGEGRPVSISLPVDKRAVDELASLPTQIRDDGGLIALLSAFRGARVTLQTGAESSVEGRIVGLETINVIDEHGNSATDWRTMIKQDDGQLQVVQVADITSMKMNDRTLEVGLEKSLDISLNEGTWKPIELKIRMSDSATRQVLLSYIVAMPIWKPAYRLVLGEKEEGIFQGWAVVDNVSGSDWNDVKMALVAGTPMSFVYDLYSPQFVTRPDLTSRNQRVAIAPPKAESAYAMAEKKVEEESRKDTKSKSRARKPDAKPSDTAAPSGAAGYGGWAELDEETGDYGGDSWDAPAAEPAPTMDLDAFVSNFVAATEGTEVSALFQYDLSNPVTVPDRSSALVNLVHAKGEAREVVLFRTEIYYNYDAMQPYRAVEFKNASGYNLEPGPITLYNESTFIGEGLLPRTAEGAIAYVTFAIDTEVTLKSSTLEEEEAAKIMKIHGGNLESELKSVTSLSYELKNNRAEEVLAVIRRPIRAGWTLDPMPADVKQAAGAYYIPVTLKANETTTFKLREVTPVRRTLSLDSNLTLELLKLQVSENALDPALKAQIETVIEKRAELNSIQEELNDLRQQKYELSDEASRISNSLADIKDIKENSAKALRDQLVKRASELETEIGKRSTRIAELSLQESDTERTLRALFRSITFERKDEQK
ncbi:MAG: hypothetical protein COW42_16790 [Deltaproteobacteria bacterium CG17_big_fil_post_rev_8_21_14_2_50_63_7]|nr:MAG: hypothetical protein COW42_16790 [Deltaproteobacteria bacterium CG17_big_fil_post_rev_8_21_14_2_50_63_7]